MDRNQGKIELDDTSKNLLNEAIKEDVHNYLMSEDEVYINREYTGIRELIMKTFIGA